VGIRLCIHIHTYLDIIKGMWWGNSHIHMSKHTTRRTADQRFSESPARTDTYIYIYTYIHLYICIYIYKHIHIYTYTSMLIRDSQSLLRVQTLIHRHVWGHFRMGEFDFVYTCYTPNSSTEFPKFSFLLTHTYIDTFKGISWENSTFYTHVTYRASQQSFANSRSFSNIHTSTYLRAFREKTRLSTHMLRPKQLNRVSQIYVLVHQYIHRLI